MLKKYLVWFHGNRDRTETVILAADRTSAISVFAQRNNCIPSSYIAARLLKSKESHASWQ